MPELAGVARQVIETPVPARRGVVDYVAIGAGAPAGTEYVLPPAAAYVRLFVFQVLSEHVVARLLHLARLQILLQALPMLDWQKVQVHHIHDGGRNDDVFRKIADHAAPDSPRRAHDQRHRHRPDVAAMLLKTAMMA